MMIVMIMLWLFVSGRRGGGDLSQNLSPDDVVGLEPRQPEKVQVAAGKTFVYKLTCKTFVNKSTSKTFVNKSTGKTFVNKSTGKTFVNKSTGKTFKNKLTVNCYLDLT